MATKMDLTAVVSDLTERYIRLPLFQKIILPLLVIGSVAGIVTISKWASRPGYSVLYSDLEPADSAAVIERLKEQKIKYEVRGDGTTIAISPPELVHELRIGMAGEGIPKGGTVGLEIFDSATLGTTTFQERMKLRRAIQGELERTISAMEEVSSTRVAITQPEPTIFAKKGSDPTASVLLMLRPGAELTKKQIKGIANLVAGSVEGLAVENVTIVDVHGNLLTPSEEDEEGLGAEATRLQYKHEIEQGYVKRIEQMLGKVVGPEKVVARVTADLDFSVSEREEETFDPGGQVIRSERSVEEGAGASQRGGIPGTVSNLSDDPNLLAAPGSDVNNSSRKESLKNFEVSRAVSKTSTERGQLKRLSVAVLVDGHYKTVAGSGETTDAPAFEPLEPDVMTQIESLVKSAVGYDAARGDTLTVENIAFHTPQNNFSAILEQEALWDRIGWFLRNGLPYVFLLFFFLILVRPLVRFLVNPTEAEVDLTRLLPTGIAELEQELEAERSKAKIPEIEPQVDLDQLNELIAENSSIVKSNPQQAALLIRYWLNDGRM